MTDFRSERSRRRERHSSDRYWDRLSMSPPCISEDERRKKIEYKKLETTFLNQKTNKAVEIVKTALADFHEFELTFKFGKETKGITIDVNHPNTNMDHAARKQAGELVSKAQVILPGGCEFEIHVREESNRILFSHVHFHRPAHVGAWPYNNLKEEWQGHIEASYQKRPSFWEISWESKGKSFEIFLDQLDENEYGQVLEQESGKRKKGNR